MGQIVASEHARSTEAQYAHHVHRLSGHFGLQTSALCASYVIPSEAWVARIFRCNRKMLCNRTGTGLSLFIVQLWQGSARCDSYLSSEFQPLFGKVDQHQKQKSKVDLKGHPSRGLKHRHPHKGCQGGTPSVKAGRSKRPFAGWFSGPPRLHQCPYARFLCTHGSEIVYCT